MPLSPYFNPTIPQSELNKALAAYKQQPTQFSEQDKKLLQDHARYYNVPFAEDEQSNEVKIGGLVSQLGKGFFHGLTTYDPYHGKDEPRNEWESISRNIGHLAGFVGFIPAAPFKLLGLKTLAQAAKNLRGRSAPMLAANFVTKQAKKIASPIAAKAITARAGATGVATKFLGRPVVQDMIEGGFHLGVASSASSWQEGVDGMMQSFIGGVQTGAVFRGIGNLVKTDSETANKVIRGISSSLYQGMHATMAGATTPEQIYEYLLGAYFGVKEMPYHRRQGGQHLNKMMKENKTDPETVEGWSRLDDKTQKYTKEKTEQIFGDKNVNLAIGYKLATDLGIDVNKRQDWAEEWVGKQEKAVSERQGELSTAEEELATPEERVVRARIIEARNQESTVDTDPDMADTGDTLPEKPTYKMATANHVKREWRSALTKMESEGKDTISFVDKVSGDLEAEWSRLMKESSEESKAMSLLTGEKRESVNPSDKMVKYIADKHGLHLGEEGANFWRLLGNKQIKQERVPLLTWANGELKPMEVFIDPDTNLPITPTNLAGNRKELREERKVIDSVYEKLAPQETEGALPNRAYAILDHMVVDTPWGGKKEIPLTDAYRHFSDVVSKTRNPETGEPYGNLKNSPYEDRRAEFYDMVKEKVTEFETKNMLTMDRNGMYYFGGRGDAARHYYLKYHPQVGKTPEAVNANLDLINKVYTHKVGRDFAKNYKEERAEWIETHKGQDPILFDKAYISNVFYDVSVNGFNVNAQGIGKVLDSGFINSAKNFNKRSQIWFTSGLSSNPDYISSQLVNSKVGLKDGKYKVQIVEDDAISELHTDGAIIGHPDVIKAMNNDYGLPSEGGVVKSFITSPNSKYGALLGKYMIHSTATDSMRKYMEDKGIHMIIPRSAAKQAGLRGELRIDKDSKQEIRTFGQMGWKGGKVVVNGTAKEVEVFEIPAKDFRGVLTEKTDRHMLDDVSLPKQMQSNLTPYTWSALSLPEGAMRDAEIAKNEATIGDMYNSLSKRSFEGSQAVNEKLGLLMNNPQKNDYLLPYLEQNFNEIGIPHLLRAMKAKGNERFANMAFNKIQRSNEEFLRELVQEGELSVEDVAEFRRESGEMLQVHEKLMSYGDGSLAGLFHKYGVGYKDMSLRNFVVKRLTKPIVGNSFSARMRPFDISLQHKQNTRELLKNENAFFLDDGFKDFKLYSEHWKGARRLEDVWNDFSKGEFKKQSNELHESIKETLNGAIMRVPMDSISGAHVLDFKGFTGAKGYGVLLHPKSMDALGGADLDGDKAFGFFGSEDYGFKKSWKDLYKSQKNENAGADIDTLKAEYRDIFTHSGGADDRVNSIFHQYSPVTRRKASENAYIGRNMLGPTVVNRSILNAAYSTLRASEKGRFEYVLEDEFAPKDTPKLEFDKLPSKSSSKNMIYTGVGSTTVPSHIKSEMAKLAKKLEAAGYTLRTGDARGSDKAFRTSVSKKEVYKPSDATSRTLKIAEEIHPAWNRMGLGGKKLQARNTFQVFGKDLNTPSDFLIAWTKGGEEHYSQRSIDTGGTGQAIELASRKGIPVINLANPNWSSKLEAVLRGETPIVEKTLSEGEVKVIMTPKTDDANLKLFREKARASIGFASDPMDESGLRSKNTFFNELAGHLFEWKVYDSSGNLNKELTNRYNDMSDLAYTPERRSGLIKMMSDINSKLYGKNSVEGRRWEPAEIDATMQKAMEIPKESRNNMLPKLAESMEGVSLVDTIFHRLHKNDSGQFTELRKVYGEYADKLSNFRWLREALGRSSMAVQEGNLLDFMERSKIYDTDVFENSLKRGTQEWENTHRLLKKKGSDGKHLIPRMRKEGYEEKINDPEFKRFVLKDTLKKAQDFIVNDLSDIASIKLLDKYGQPISGDTQRFKDIVNAAEEIKRKNYLTSQKHSLFDNIGELKIPEAEKSLLRKMRGNVETFLAGEGKLMSQSEVDGAIIQLKRDMGFTPEESAFFDAMILSSVKRGYNGIMREINYDKNSGEAQGYSETFSTIANRIKQVVNDTSTSRLGLQSEAISQPIVAEFIREYSKLYDTAATVNQQTRTRIVNEAEVAEAPRPIRDENGNTVRGSTIETPEVDTNTKRYLDEYKPFEDLHDGTLTGEAQEIYYSLKEHLNYYQNGIGKGLNGMTRDLLGKDLNAMNLEDFKVLNNYFKDMRTGTWYQKMFDKVISKSPEIKKRYWHMFPEAINRDMLRYELELMKTKRPYKDKDGNEKIGEALRPTGVIDMLQRTVHSAQENSVNVGEEQKRIFKEKLRPYVDGIKDGRKFWRMAVRIREEKGFGHEQFDYKKYLREEKKAVDWENIKNKEYNIIDPETGKTVRMKGEKITEKINDIITEQNEVVHTWLKGDGETAKKYLDLDDGTHEGLIRLRKKFIEDLRESNRKGQPITMKIGLEGLNHISKRIILSQLPKYGRAEAQANLRENMKVQEMGKFEFDKYFPHINFHRGSARKRLLEQLNKTLDDSSLTQNEMDKKVKGLIYHYKQLTGDWVQQNEMGDRWNELDGFIEQIATKKKTSKEYIQWIKNQMTIGNQYSRSKDPIPGWDIDPEAYNFYMKNVIDTYYKMTSQISARTLINDWSADFYKRHDKDVGLTNSWRNFLRLYVQDSMGYPSQIPEKILNDKRMKLKGTPYAWMADSKVLGIVNKVAKKLNVRQVNLPEELRGFGYKDLTSWTNMEAKYQLASLLAHPKSSITNLYGGTTQTIISTGWDNFKKARDINYLKTMINPKWNKMEDVEDWVKKHGVIEEFLIHEADINPKVKGEKWNKFMDNALNLLKKDPNAPDSSLRELWKKAGMSDRLFDKAAWFMRRPERTLRRDSFVGHYLQAKEKFGNAVTDYNDPILIELAKKGVKSTQFLYSAPFRPAFARTALGKVMTRFQLWSWNSVRFRNDILREAKVRGFRKGTQEFERFKRMATWDLLSLGLANIFMYSIFENALPAPWNWFQDTADFMFGDDKERERAFFGAYPHPLQPLQVITPPAFRLLPPLFKGMVNDDYSKFANYYLWTMAPFGRLAKDVVGPGGLLENPVYGIEKMTGIPYVKATKSLKSAFAPKEEEEDA